MPTIRAAANLILRRPKSVRRSLVKPIAAKRHMLAAVGAANHPSRRRTMFTTSPVAMTSARAIVACGAISIALAASATFAGGTPVLHEAQKLIASDGISEDKFGFALDRHGDTLIIGAPQHYTNSLPGSFYVFTRDPSGDWLEQQRVMSDFQPGEAEFGDQFGAAVALEGDTLLVGAPFVESGGVMLVGSVHVFTRDATGEWASQQTITPVDQNVTRFGENIALAGDVAVIAGIDRAFVFQRDGAGVWSLQSELLGLELDFVGPVAFDGQRIVVADGAFSPGDHRAHIFNNNGNGWTLASTVVSPPTFLGRIADVSLDGDQLALGLPDAAGPDRAFVYENVEAKSWSQEATLDPNSLDNDSFGMDVKLNNSLLLAGANHAGANGITYLYQRDAAGAWIEHAQLTPSDTFAHNFAMKSISTTTSPSSARGPITRTACIPARCTCSLPFPAPIPIPPMSLATARWMWTTLSR
jgi:hypothetical protein